MRRARPAAPLASIALALILLSACAGPSRSQADQDRDGRTLATAMRAAYVEGSTFKLDQRLLLTGGDIPSGKGIQAHAVVTDGAIRDDAARFSYRIEQGQQASTYDMMIAEGRIFVRPSRGTAWKTTPVAAASSLFPALRLDLLRQTVLLARSISSGAVGHVDAGFARKYVVRPAPDQLEQLESIPVEGQGEQQFLKTATAELDVFLLVPGNRLGRVELHMSGTDPESGTKQEVLSVLDLRAGKVSAIQPPADAQAASPSDLLATS